MKHYFITRLTFFFECWCNGLLKCVPFIGLYQNIIFGDRCTLSLSVTICLPLSFHLSPTIFMLLPLCPLFLIFKGEVSPNLDNPFKRTNYAKFCMLLSLDGTMPESVISQDNNSPLTLYIEFHNCYFFLDINSPVHKVQSQMHAQSS